MELWLTPEDLGRLRGAVHVGTGLTRIIERIELRIAELDEPEQKRRWSLWWSAAASDGPDKRDMAYLDALRADYEWVVGALLVSLSCALPVDGIAGANFAL